ncbi:MAG: restriction endonuclease subunit S [Deltaproteobacteria bacterium]|nr:restriction endonuclease subunit S [Deltaproteobacteria bacterium]
MSENKGIPYGWKTVKLGEIANYVNGKAFKPTEWSKDGLPIIRIQNLNREKSEFNYCNFAVDDKYYVNKGDLLFAWSGTPDTSFGAHIWLGGRAVLNQHIFRIVVDEKEITKQYYLYALNHKVKEFVSKAHGTAGLAHITKNKFEESTIALPPLSEQQRIVAKIEELFSSLDKGIESLKTAQQQLKVYRQAVLKWAFEGKLINKFENWRKTTLGEVISISSGSGLTKAGRNENGKYLVYGGNGITGKHNEYLFKKEKLIIGRVGAQCGNAHITKPHSWVTDNAFVVTFDELVFDINYLYHLIISLNLNKYSSSTAQPVISQGKIYPIEIAVPKTISEQQAIVAEIESRLSVCDKIEESIEQSLKQSESLRQSILKKAFEGKLVPQDPNDEQASKLLERIKAARKRN